MTTALPYIVGLGGSLRENSTSLIALRYALTAAERAGAETSLLSAPDLALPFYDDRDDRETYPESVSRLLHEIRRCRGIIIASPVYHSSMSGAVKNILDFLELLGDDQPPWLEGKIVGLITVAGGRPRSDAIVSLEIACRALHAWTVPLAVSISDSAFDGDTLVDGAIKERLERLGRIVVGTSESPGGWRSISGVRSPT